MALQNYDGTNFESQVIPIEFEDSRYQLLTVLWVLDVPQSIFAPGFVKILMKAFMGQVQFKFDS